MSDKLKREAVIRRLKENKEAERASMSEIGPWKSDLLPEMLVPRYGGTFESWDRPGSAQTDMNDKIVRAYPFQGPNTTAHEIGHLDPRMSWLPNIEEKEIVAWDIARKILQDLGIIQDEAMRDAALKTYGVTLVKEQK